MKMIRNILFIMIIMVPISLLADNAPTTTCPTGYISTKFSSAILVNDSCPDGYRAIGTVTSCLVANPDGTCAMFVPADVTYTDGTGGYHFISMCPLS